mmetsp:Transcript_11451/g.27365  ORF Transcript_11451/g.27365 Transcript_11451/m.27365 type:complete len:128 (+) Transcript_11451:1-384(+)
MYSSHKQKQFSCLDLTIQLVIEEQLNNRKPDVVLAKMNNGFKSLTPFFRLLNRQKKNLGFFYVLQNQLKRIFEELINRIDLQYLKIYLQFSKASWFALSGREGLGRRSEQVQMQGSIWQLKQASSFW